MLKRFFCAFAVIYFVFVAGCTSYRITSDPARAKIHYKGNITYKPIPFAQYTPIKVRKGIEWPYGYEYVAVEWPDGVWSDWRLLNKDQHFVKGSIRPVNQEEDARIVDLTFDSVTSKGVVAVDTAGHGLAAREMAIKKIGEICSSKNVMHVAGQENLKTDGGYKILDEELKDNILTITFEAVR